MPRHISRTYQRAAQAHSKVMAARQSMLSRTPAPAAETEEPMRRYVFPISQPVRTRSPRIDGPGEVTFFLISPPSPCIPAAKRL